MAASDQGTPAIKGAISLSQESFVALANEILDDLGYYVCMIVKKISAEIGASSIPRP